MVKGAARNAGSTSSGAPPQALPTMQAGQNVHDPLTQLNGHQGYGLMAGLNPFADMGVNPNDPNMVCFCLLAGCCVGSRAGVSVCGLGFIRSAEAYFVMSWRHRWVLRVRGCVM